MLCNYQTFTNKILFTSFHGPVLFFLALQLTKMWQIDVEYFFPGLKLSREWRRPLKRGVAETQTRAHPRLPYLSLEDRKALSLSSRALSYIPLMRNVITSPFHAFFFLAWVTPALIIKRMQRRHGNSHF